MLYSQSFDCCHRRPSSGVYLRTRLPCLNLELNPLFNPRSRLFSFKGYYVAVRTHQFYSPLYCFFLSSTEQVYAIFQYYQTQELKPIYFYQTFNPLSHVVEVQERLDSGIEISFDYSFFGHMFLNGIYVYARSTERVVIV